MISSDSKSASGRRLCGTGAAGAFFAAAGKAFLLRAETRHAWAAAARLLTVTKTTALVQACRINVHVDDLAARPVLMYLYVVLVLTGALATEEDELLAFVASLKKDVVDK